LRAMLDVKWKNDMIRGKGFDNENLDRNQIHFDPVEFYFEPILKEYLISADTSRSNHDIFEFSINHGFLPKHSNELLTKFAEYGNLLRRGSNGTLVKNNFINDRERDVYFEWIPERQGNLFASL